MLMLPTFDAPAYSYTIALDGRDYTLSLVYSERTDDWRLSIFDAAGEPIARGQRIVSNFPLFRRLVDARMPSGALIALDMRRQPRDPGLADFGEQVRLAYLSADDIAQAKQAQMAVRPETFEEQ